MLILKGVTISKGTIVAAGSLVTKSTKPYSIVKGVPARFHKFRWNNNEIQLHLKRLNGD